MEMENLLKKNYLLVYKCKFINIYGQFIMNRLSYFFYKGYTKVCNDPVEAEKKVTMIME